MSVALAQKQPVSAASRRGRCRRHAGRRFFDTTHSAWMVKVFPGEFYVTRQPDEILVTVLGSCVSACIRDPVIGVGGMNHFMLAKGHSGGWGDDPQSARFGNFAMEKLINELIKAGCSRERMEIKVFGGGNVIDASTAIGSDNAEFVLRYLEAEGLRCAAEDLGGSYPRRIHYYPGDRPRRAPAAGNRRNLRDQPRRAGIRRPAAVAAACGRNPSVWRCGVNI